MVDYTEQINALSGLHNNSSTADNEPYIEIFESNHTISIPKDFPKIIALEYEANSNIVSFKCPRYIEGHDISQCIYKFIKWENVGAQTADVYFIKDVSVVEQEILLTWNIGPEITTKAGKINFQIGFMDSTVDSTPFKWMTEPCNGQLEIGTSLYNSKIDSINNTPIIPDTEINKTDLETMLKEVYG